MQIFDILLERGFIAKNEDGTPKQVTNPEIRDILNSKSITAYIGFDPTASSFHVGNLLQIMILSHLQRAGHRPIVVVGGGTGLIGDPSGKTEMRKMLTLEKVQENMSKQKEQFKRYIDFSEGKALMVNNADWLLGFNYIDFLRDYGRHFSVNRMLTADCIKNRLETGLSFLEFNYMILQSYDFLHLHKTYGCLLQMGGDDQWGNICSGIELIRRVEGKECYGITCPLLTTASGSKMGKTEKGAVWLDAELFSPYEYYQYWRNVDDRDVIKCLSLFTFLDMEEIRKLSQLKDAQINEAKEVLAFEATKITHGEKAALQAQQDAKSLFGEQKTGDSIPTVEIPLEEIQKGIWVIELIKRSGLETSNSEARRLVQKGGAYINQDKIDSIDLQVTEKYVSNGEMILRAGKKRYVRVLVK
ncbi:MAG: tyrosine--tRNA ligase [Candidatus Brocadiae bacterium]|nr:tyrosine--tRNA ligase [Candidatus Brocadiia bacterium]